MIAKMAGKISKILPPNSLSAQFVPNFQNAASGLNKTRNQLQALIELGRAVKTSFLCRYLNLEELRQEIQEGLNVVENWNSANSFICYGKSGELTSNHRAEQELSLLSLHLLQMCLVYINTLMMQKVLSESDWSQLMSTEDLRGITPLVYVHINPYGKFELNLEERLNIQLAA
jgi:hypothetical protein